jgi:hypothetical protein
MLASRAYLFVVRDSKEGRLLGAVVGILWGRKEESSRRKRIF